MFAYDFTANAGSAAELKPALERVLRDTGWFTQRFPDGKVLVRLEAGEGGRAQVALSLGPDEAGLLTASLPVFTAPAPAPDGLYGSLAAWNSAAGAFTAVAEEAETEVQVVLRGVLPPRLGEGEAEPWPAAELRAWLEELARQKARLLPLLSGGQG